jgi:hypothetical protein
MRSSSPEAVREPLAGMAEDIQQGARSLKGMLGCGG